ncbi:MAG: hypothetical protein KDB14_29690, partial [Planctomycetales bacterium]|nr:hypothetical protein [Planctomycetales bacterium]
MSLTNAVETELTSDGRFGDWRLILGHVYSHYTSGLDALGNSVPCAARVRCKLAEEGSARVVEELGDPGVRIALNRMLELHKAGKRELAFELLPVLDAVESNLQEVRRLRFVGSNLTGLGANIEVWTSDRSGPADEIFNSAFNKEIASSVSDEAVALCDPSPAMLSTLQRGLNLLISLVPRLAVGMLAHVRMVAVIDVADVSHRFGRVRYNMCQNVSTHAIPGTIFLSPTPLENEWRAAEALLHEAMHKRLSDLVLTKSIFRTGFSSADSPT